MTTWQPPHGGSGPHFVPAANIKPGDRVKLWPQDETGVFTMFLDGKTGTIAGIEPDDDGSVYVAVQLDIGKLTAADCPRPSAHLFFLRPEEIELLPAEEPAAELITPAAAHR
jgi:hypothetical protein